jgi:hypothetical protein
VLDVMFLLHILLFGLLYFHVTRRTYKRWRRVRPSGLMVRAVVVVLVMMMGRVGVVMMVRNDEDDDDGDDDDDDDDVLCKDKDTTDGDPTRRCCWG